jgi:glycerophosphoryl diester phosphodiesterase
MATQETQETGEGAAVKTEEPPRGYRRIGHKGADIIVEGNTIESFEMAVEVGVDMVELDVLRTREGQLIVAHDYLDAADRRPLTLSQALDAFRHPPLDDVEIDCDLKLAGREAELAGAIAGHGLTERTMVSTMEVESLVKLRSIDSELRLGWTIPKTRRDWTRDRWARPALGAGLALMRRRLPKLIAERAPELDVDAIWAYHPLITSEAIEAAHNADLELYAWTVDTPERVAEVAALGVDGIVSNDPRLLN